RSGKDPASIAPWPSGRSPFVIVIECPDGLRARKPPASPDPPFPLPRPPPDVTPPRRRKASGPEIPATLPPRSPAEERPQRGLERATPVLRIEPPRVQFPAQPGDLALGELPGGEDGPVAEGRRVGHAVEVFPCLAVADGTDRGQVQRR